jgi:hypothetical protein
MRSVQTTNNSWGLWMDSMILLNELPPSTRLSLTLFARRKFKEDIPLGWVNHQLFDYKGQLSQGIHSLNLWLNDRYNPIGLNFFMNFNKMKDLHIPNSVFFF